MSERFRGRRITVLFKNFGREFAAELLGSPEKLDYLVQKLDGHHPVSQAINGVVLFVRNLGKPDEQWGLEARRWRDIDEVVAGIQVGETEFIYELGFHAFTHPAVR